MIIIYGGKTGEQKCGAHTPTVSIETISSTMRRMTHSQGNFVVISDAENHWHHVIQLFSDKRSVAGNTTE